MLQYLKLTNLMNMSNVSISNQLSAVLLDQVFSIEETNDIEVFKKQVENYVSIEQCTAVLSDFKANCSYIYSGSFGEVFGFPSDNSVIDSAFEECIFNKIHPDDVIERHILELDYFHFLKSLPYDASSKFSTSSRIRTQNISNCFYIHHRTIYLKSFSNGSVWLALCLYAPSVDVQPRLGIDGKIINIQTGEVIATERYKVFEKTLLSKRELEVLTLVAKGSNSVQIAGELNISVYTVRRHRQNIIEKMKVANTAEAVKTALIMGIIVI